MSDDVFEAFGGDDIFEEDDELQEPEGGDQNRTFIIAVAVLGGLLVCALISFGVWALVLNRPQEVVPEPTEAAATATLELTATVELATDTPAPTDTPEPTATPLLGPTATPDETGAMGQEAGEEMGEETGDATGEEAGEETPAETVVARRSPTPTATPRSTPTPRVSGGTSSGVSGELSQTGLGEWMLVGGAVFLVAIMVLARRLRKA